jgi:hypothetical protein
MLVAKDARHPAAMNRRDEFKVPHILGIVKFLPTSTKLAATDFCGARQHRAVQKLRRLPNKRPTGYRCVYGDWF